MAKLKTLTPYYGGKFNKVGRFIAEILPKHRHYVEPCGGMAGVLMIKEPSFCEIYNDIDNNIVNLFEVVRDPILCKQLEELLHLTPYSREEWRRCQKTFRTETDPLEKARKVYVTLSMGFAGSLGNKAFSWGGPKYESSVARTFFNGLESLPVIHHRIKNIIIENKDALDIAKKWDTSETLQYWDPPYRKENRKTFGDYSEEIDSNYHAMILDFLISCKSKIILSGYDNEVYNSALSGSDFRKISLSTFSAVSLSNGKGYDSKRTECLWINYQAKDFSNPLFEVNFQSTRKEASHG